MQIRPRRFAALAIALSAASVIASSPEPPQQPAGQPAAAGQPTAISVPTPAPPASLQPHREEGRPFVRSYGPAEIAGDGQNWSIVQDARGVIYVGSASGVLEFDGASWRLIETPTLDTVRSLDIDEAGRVFVGSVGDFGYLAPDARGELRFVSLKGRVPADARDFADVWRTLVTRDGVVFQSQQFIFRLAGDTIHVIRPQSFFNRASAVDGRLYLPVPESGLNVLEGDTLRPLPGTESFGREAYGVLLRYDDRRLLFGTRRNGLFLYDGSTLTPFRTELDGLFRTASLYRGIALPDSRFALATTNGGFAIIDREGRRVALVDKAHGLPSDVVYYLMADREGSVWAALDRGVARVDTPSPVSFFDGGDGFTDSFSTIRHAGRLYLAGQSGVAYLHDATAGSRERVTVLSGLSHQCWWFERMPDTAPGRPEALAVACTDGLYEIRDLTLTAIKAPDDGTYRAAYLVRSTVDRTRLWVGLFGGLASFRRVNGRWIDEGRIAEVGDEVRTVVENADGSLWVGTSTTGLLRVSFASRPSPDAPRPATSTVERFGAKDGLPPSGVAVVSVNGVPYFTPWGSARDYIVATYDPAGRRFVRDRSFEQVGFDRFRVGFGVVEFGDELLVNLGKGTAVARRGADGSWTFDKRVFSRFGQEPMGLVRRDPDGVAWFTWQNTLVRFDLSRPPATPVPFRTLVRRVSAAPAGPLFAGAGPPPSPRLPADTGTVRIEFAAPTFLDETATEYQTMLEGFEDGWTPWTKEPRRDYMNLGFGDYRFRVRARNFTGLVSEEASVAFTILSPWYRTWWAYACYLMLAGFVAIGVDRFQRARVLRAERERSTLTEARLRAEAAEALARSESEGKKNIELISEIGREVTASLDFETIFGRLYDRVNALADAEVFGVGLYHPDRHEIEYRLAIERGKRYAPYTRDTNDRNQLAVWCIEQRQPVFINDAHADFGKYIGTYDAQTRQLEDGSMSEQAQSMIYMPLLAKERALGIITIQSFKKHAYTTHHLNVMRSLAAYTAIALDNAAAYRQLNEQEHEIRRLLAEAERARAAAEEADAAKSAFLSTVSHELRTPLTSVLGFAKIIKKRLEERIFPTVHTDDQRVRSTMQQVEENLKVVVSEGERLTQLIDDVLDLAKIEAGRIEWKREPVAIPDIIERATAATGSLFEQKALRLVKDAAHDLPVLTGDRDRLIQVVINLISNAVKFTDVGSVTCRARLEGDAVVVSVVDTGVGIAPADQPKVFERFRQVGDTLTDKPKGTGLGLPICKEIVEHHGGRLWVESEVGRGSTFAFSLPVNAGAAAADAGEARVPLALASLIRHLHDQVPVPALSGEARRRILVVDDDPNIRELLTQELTEAGYRVSVAGTGRAAVEAVRRDRPNLIVLDVMMPDLNGFDVAAVLKSDPATSDIPIVILSILQDRERGLRIGVDRYLTKPIDTDLLFREVGSLLEQQTSRRRVLVVDDDETAVQALRSVLTAKGYSVSGASGADLRERALAVQPDIIVLNSIMSARSSAVQTLRFEKGMENVLFFVSE